MIPEPSLLSALDKAKHVLLHFHLSPDPDSIGSSLAMVSILETLGKKVTVFSEDRLPPYVGKLPLGDRVTVEPLDLATRTDYDLYLSLDTPKWSMATRSAVRPLKPVISIDHHPDNEIRPDFEWLEPTAACTAEMLLHLIHHLDTPIDADLATNLLFAVLGETSCLQNSNTSPAALQAVVELTSLGARYQECIDLLMRSYSVLDLKSWGGILSTVSYGPNNWYIYMSIDYEHWALYGTKIPTGELANMFNTKVAGTKFGALFIEKSPGFTNCSLRGRDRDFDLSALAHEFGGGGHTASASVRFELPLKQAVNKFITKVGELYDDAGIIRTTKHETKA